MGLSSCWVHAYAKRICSSDVTCLRGGLNRSWVYSTGFIQALKVINWKFWELSSESAACFCSVLLADLWETVWLPSVVVFHFHKLHGARVMSGWLHQQLIFECVETSSWDWMAVTAQDGFNRYVPQSLTEDFGHEQLRLASEKNSSRCAFKRYRLQVRVRIKNLYLKVQKVVEYKNTLLRTTLLQLQLTK